VPARERDKPLSLAHGLQLATHGLIDEIIPFRVEQALHSQWCAMGVASQLNGYPGDHVLTALLDQSDTVNWLSGRLAGRPAPANC
jgi:hypothetical protein